jgi:glycosyltransferase involved in cell wall biosynthesis
MVMPYFPPRMALLLKFLVLRSAAMSAAVITVSENSKRDIVRICGIPAAKVHVIYEGYDRKLFNDSELDSDVLEALLNRLKIHRPYILHHGAIQPRKNLVRLIAAYRRVLTRNRNFNFDLVLAGPLVWQCEDTISAAQNSAKDRGRVVLTGTLSDSDLSLLLKGAALVVIPSLYEGFCLPMVEAMACGVPTIAANNSCLPEISGGVLRYFDPYLTEEMAMRIEEVLQHKELQTELSQRGKAHVQKYNWQLCAEESLAVLSQVAGHSRRGRKSTGVAV